MYGKKINSKSNQAYLYMYVYALMNLLKYVLILFK